MFKKQHGMRAVTKWVALMLCLCIVVLGIPFMGSALEDTSGEQQPQQTQEPAPESTGPESGVEAAVPTESTTTNEDSSAPAAPPPPAESKVESEGAQSQPGKDAPASGASAPEQAASAGSNTEASSPSSLPEEELEEDCEGPGFEIFQPLFQMLDTLGEGHTYSGMGYVTPPPATGENISIGDTFDFIGHTGYDVDNPHVAVIANDLANRYGAMWAKDKLDLSNPFSTEIYLYMAHGSAYPGDKTAGVGDGMTFTLHNDSRGTAAVGSDGEGLGVYGSTYYVSPNPNQVVSKAMAVEFDLMHNQYKPNLYYEENIPGTDRDHYMYDPEPTAPANAHCSIIYPPHNANGSVQSARILPKALVSGMVRPNFYTYHKNTMDFTKKAEWVKFEAVWTPQIAGNGTVGGTLTYTFDGQTNSETIDNVVSKFGSTEVHWGFTGATGDNFAVLAAAVTHWPEQVPFKSVEDESGNVPGEVEKDDLLTYTVTYANYTGAVATVVLEDELPPGVDYVSDDSNGSYNAATRTVTWTFANQAVGQTEEVKVQVRVNASARPGGTIENEATMTIGGDSPISNKVVTNVKPKDPDPEDPDPGGELDTTVTAEKSASVANPDDPAKPNTSPGTADNPVVVEFEEYIDYMLNVNATPPGVRPTPYDILFVLDWSDSTNHLYLEDNTSSSGQYVPENVRFLARDMITQLSKRVLEEYDGSRVAVMGVNSWHNLRNQNDPRSTYLQVDTNFVGYDQYETIIKNAYAKLPANGDDDNPTFFRAAIDKMLGDTSTTYGSGSGVTGDTPKARTVRARDELDQERIPVIIMISDFQWAEVPNLYGQTFTSQFWEGMNAQANRFAQEYDNGIFLAVRTHSKMHTWSNATDDSKNYIKYSPEKDTVYRTKMQELVDKGNGRWGSIDFTNITDHANGNQKMWEFLEQKVPAVGADITVTDYLPEGLEVEDLDNHISAEFIPHPDHAPDDPDDLPTIPKPTYTYIDSGPYAGRYKVEWKLDQLLIGDTKFHIKAKAVEPGVYANSATVKVNDWDPIETNYTYHKADPPFVTIHARQVLINRGNNPVQAPMVGRLALGTPGGQHNFVCPSGTSDAVRFVAHTIAYIKEPLYSVAPTIPQYFSYVGYRLTPVEQDHNDSPPQSGSIELDYAAAREYWLTIYIEPVVSMPGDHQSSVEGNYFGEIYTA